MSSTYSVYVCVSIVFYLSDMKIVSFLALPYFSMYPQNSTIAGRNVLNTKSVLGFYLQLLSETFPILTRIQR